MGLTVGIDLGTTYSVISYIDPQRKDPIIIKNRQGDLITPSAVGIKADGSYVIGVDAKNMEESGDINTASFYKPYMGDHDHIICIRGRDYTAKDLSGMFLKRLVSEAEIEVNQKITDAVITVPAYFGDAAKNDTLEAGKMAGLNVLNIINEPTAACVAYGLRDDGLDRKILVYDLGGGTFDVSVASIESENISIIGTIGHHRLGGQNWDESVANWLADRFFEETGEEIYDDEEMFTINMVKAEKAKKELSSSKFTDITVDSGNNKCKIRLTRDEFEEITAAQLNITISKIDELFENIKIGWSDLDGAVLVGGSTKMPMVRNFLESKGIKILDGVHPDLAVSIGAAIQASISDYCMIQLKGAPKKVSSLSLKSGDNVNFSLLPGAKMISDVISHSLGQIMVSADGKKFVNDIMIVRNTKCSEAHTTKTRELGVRKNKKDNKLDIYLLQGESEEPLDCVVTKKYVFKDIDFVPGGKTYLDITFFHTYNGTIDVKAVQTETGKELSYIEEPIPNDMSWVEKSPEGVFGSNKSETSGVLIMALDVSGSMYEKTDGKYAMDYAKEAMMGFAREFVGTGIDVGICGFSDRFAFGCKPTDDIVKIDKAIRRLDSMGLGSCNAAEPLYNSLDEMLKYADGSFGYIIVLTDGAWESEACSRAISAKQEYIKNGFEIIGMGFGFADLDFLKRISTKSELAKVDDIKSLNSNLSSIAKIINN